MIAGMTASQLEELAAPSVNAVKTSRRDLAYVLSQGLTGGTTVSGTMVAAQRAGIPVFVTGGIGGVHRGAETTLDISADLRELGRTPVAVISAGVKSILDIGRTLEYLETEGVCVVSYGTSKDFPAFFTPKSGFSAPYNVETPKDAAKLIDTMLSLRLKSGLLISVPIPEQDMADGDIIEQAVQQAVDESSAKNIKGKEVTPYILQRVSELTSGRSLQANIALVKNNARVGGQISCELSLLRGHSIVGQWSSGVKRSFHSYPGQESNAACKEGCDGRSCKKAAKKQTDHCKHGDIVVIGGTNVDISATVKTDGILTNGATYPGKVRVSFGGVGRNLADALSRLQCTPLFLSAIGVDLYAKTFTTEHTYMNLSGLKKEDSHSSALYCALLKNTGELIYGLGDFDIHTRITSHYVKRFEADLTRAPLVCIDGNIPVDTMAYICDVCSRNGVPGR
ncbi:Pseudouridine-metabolizing bifunctional protein C1861.05 [Lamellibrachia satsuma]|nr:Pseudouridine-metabolizing bifunctional protein C1861.05 [Lamellibrachia satsuma]